ncbi:MAG: biotin transporter BioY, partial [Cyanobacteria bacterium]|nr:biotin transporter BioY [Cyanobacteriota bacterium]
LPFPHEEVRYSSYCAIGPCVIFVSYVLGPALGALAVLVYLLVGSIGPILHLFPFAAGGGLDYHLQPSFGYLLGCLLAALACGKITCGRRTSLTQLLGMSAGLVVMHLTGAAYLFGSYLYFYIAEGSKTYLEWQPWIFGYLRNLTWYSLPYDFIFSLLLIGCAFPFRWLASNLTAPDLGPPREAKYRQRVEEFV